MEQMTLTPDEVCLLMEYLMEIDAVIEADDGTCFPWPLIEKHEEIKELFL